MDGSCLTPWAVAQYFLVPHASDFSCYQALAQPMAVDPTSLGEYLGYFSLTCLLEAPFYLWGMRSLALRKRILGILILNLVTHPIVFLVLPEVLTVSWAESILWMESFAFLTESSLMALYFRRFSAAGTAVAANFSSWWIGALL